jgi:hypothetical protein
MKCIESVEMRVGDINTGFGNPRKITKKKIGELERSLDVYGNFGIFVIDENNDIIAGSQRLSVLKSKDPEATVLCKRLVGYTEAEKRAINIKDNTHSGEWDLDLLADWTADLNLDLGVDIPEKNPNERAIDEMELVNYEKYDYILIAFRDELSFNSVARSLGIEGKHCLIGPKKRKIKARAIWCTNELIDLLSKNSKENAG